MEVIELIKFKFFKIKHLNVVEKTNISYHCAKLVNNIANYLTIRDVNYESIYSVYQIQTKIHDKIQNF